MTNILSQTEDEVYYKLHCQPIAIESKFKKLVVNVDEKDLEELNKVTEELFQISPKNTKTLKISISNVDKDVLTDVKKKLLAQSDLVIIARKFDFSKNDKHLEGVYYSLSSVH